MSTLIFIALVCFHKQSTCTRTRTRTHDCLSVRDCFDNNYYYYFAHAHVVWGNDRK